MRQLVLKKYGNLPALEEVASCRLKEHEIKVRTLYAGVSFTDVIIQSGWYQYQRRHMPLPYIPGFEAVGTVIERGSEVETVEIGEKVVVFQRSGCFSEEIITTIEHVIAIPDNANLRLVASLPVNYFTAYHAFKNIVKIFPNSRVLVEAAAGGVGGMLVQLLSDSCLVTGLVGTSEKHEYVMSLGAKNSYTYSDMPKEDNYDVIFSASGENLGQYYKQLSPNGKIVVYGFHSLVPMSLGAYVQMLVKYFKMPRVSLFDLVHNNKAIAGFNIIQLGTKSVEFLDAKTSFIRELQEGKMSKHKITVVPFLDYKTAFKEIASRKHLGKVLLEF